MSRSNLLPGISQVCLSIVSKRRHQESSGNKDPIGESKEWPLRKIAVALQ